MASPHTVTSASVGTVLLSGAGAITAFTMNQLTSAAVDIQTPLTLLDLGAAPTATDIPRTLFSGSLANFQCLYEPRPNIPLTPGLTAPTWPKSVSPGQITFAKGCYVASCPPNATFTVTV
jgi:hypothetical protein